jgi:hypothetical protein
MAISTRRTNSCFACQKGFIHMYVDKTRCQPALGLPDPVVLYSRTACFKCHANWVGVCLPFSYVFSFRSGPPTNDREKSLPVAASVCAPSASDCSRLALFLSPKRSAPAPIRWSPTFCPWDGPGSRTSAPHRPPTRPSPKHHPEIRPKSSRSSQNPSNPLCRGAKAIYELSHPFGHQRVYVALCVLPLSAVGQIP